jgi:nucleotide-binding universal stress UspA family protein
MVKKILLPLDGSDHAFKALDFASDLAEKYGAVLLVLYVVTKHELPESVRRFAQVEHIEGPPNWIYDEVVAKNVLVEAQDRAQRKGVTSIETLICDGNPAKLIVEAARSKNADLIVMGTRGLSDIKGLFMGSVAHKVNQMASCTVVTVK